MVGDIWNETVDIRILISIFEFDPMKNKNEISYFVLDFLIVHWLESQKRFYVKNIYIYIFFELISRWFVIL